MKEEILSNIRDTANKRMAVRAKQLERLDELEKEPVVAEYLRLLAWSKLDITDEGLIMESFMSHEISADSTNKIYVYMGAQRKKYILSDGEPYYEDIDEASIPEDLEASDDIIKVYWDIELPQVTNVPLADSAAFEEANIVIKNSDYFAVQQEFMTTAVQTNQQEAVKQLLIKYPWD